MSNLNLTSYKNSNALNNMAVFEWDIENETLEYDEMLPHIMDVIYGFILRIEFKSKKTALNL